MSCADIDYMKFKVRLVCLGLDDHEIQSSPQSLLGMTTCPEMSCNGTIRIIETFSHLPQCAGHVAILAMLFAEALFIEVFAPLQKCLGLFPDDSFAHAVAISTH